VRNPTTHELADPIAAKLRQQQEMAQDWLSMFTVSWGTFAERRNDSPPTFVHSGVLAQIENRYFLLGAGHSFAHISPGAPISMTIIRKPHAFSLQPVRVLFEDQSTSHGQDFGILEISQQDAKSIEAAHKVFYNLKNSLPLERDRARRQDHWFWLAGFPEGLFTSVGASMWGVRIVTLPLWVAGPATRPSTLTSPTTPLEYLDFGITDKIEIASRSDYTSDRQFLPHLGGASGCGIWDMGLPRTAEDWKTEGLGLAGILVGGAHDPSAPGIWFYRCTSVLHHFRLIVQAHPHLASELLTPFNENP
jgi:hypothetical protein